MTRHEIFSTPVWHIEGAPLELVDELYQGAYQLKKIYPNNKKRSAQGGYQTPFLGWKDFHPQGIEYIEKVVGDIFKFKVKEWWYNINGKGDSNMPHTHPGVDMALVLYLTDSDGLLSFIHPFSMRVFEIEKHNHYVGVNAKKGDIVIFPADIMHFVKPNPREEDRISISMNLQLC